MHVRLDIPDELARHAQELGISVEMYIERLVAAELGASATRLLRLESGPHTPAEAGNRIRELRNSHSLHGLRLKDLIAEGRKF